MTSDRPYRKGMPFEKAEAILRENSEIQWDGRLVEAFFAALDDIHAICARSDEHGDDHANAGKKCTPGQVNIGNTFATGPTLPITAASPQ